MLMDSVGAGTRPCAITPIASSGAPAHGYNRGVELGIDVEAFIADPVGRCIAGQTWLYFYARVDLCGFIIWGAPVREDIERLVRVLKVELDAPPHASLVDARRLESVDTSVFELLATYVRENRAALNRVVRSLALVRPDGVVGAITSGFFGVTTPPYPIALFEDRAEAIAWLDVPDATSALRALAQAEDDAAGEPLLRDLRALLETRLDRASLSTAARALGMSERSFQRRLGELGTTFQVEMNHARVRVAKRKLRETDKSLTTIAAEVGCASLASFSGLFRRATGESPSRWRERR
jgi:AraC-like DNA-binding protein